MKKKHKLYVAALLLALVASTADAKGKPSGGGGGIPTNYGCMTLAAGTVVKSPDGLSQKKLLMATYACYLCNMKTHVCVLQSPSSLVGWTFVF